MSEQQMPPVVTGENEKRITRSDLIKSWLAWCFFAHANYNYERLQATGYAHSMVPVIRRLYGDDEEATREALKRHLVFYNTSPDIGGVINGVTIAMEEQRANGQPVSDTAINSTKTGLMGPLAGIGDTISQGIVTPLLLALGISIAGIQAGSDAGGGDFGNVVGNPLGPILYFVLITAYSLLLGYFAYTIGYKQGRVAVKSLFESGLMDKVIVGASVLGNLVLGALTANFVKVYVGIKIPAGDDTVFLQQDVFDKILPGMLPLGLVILTWWLLQRGWHPIRLLLIYVAVCIVGAIPFMGPAPQFVTDACGSSILQPYGPCPVETPADDGAGETEE